jgi:hypothetical protein
VEAGAAFVLSTSSVENGSEIVPDITTQFWVIELLGPKQSTKP